MLTLIRPLISSKFGKKISFIQTLSELEQHVHLSQIAIPKPILE
jgi:Rho GTPase-activating protein 1